MMQHKKGLDYYRIELDINQLMKIAIQQDWEMYDLLQKDEQLFFYASVKNRSSIQQQFPNIHLLNTTGVIGFLFRNMKNPARILCLCISILLWYVLSQTIFHVEITGEKDSVKQLIQTELDTLGYKIPMYDKNIPQMKQELRKALENDIAWLEVIKKGSELQISYTPKEFVNIKSLERNELIAKKDGVIAYFDVQHGYKTVLPNQLVTKGDVLVSNVLLDSKNKTEELYVKGRVFAYTFAKVEVSLDSGSVKNPFTFYSCLLKARDEVSNTFKEDDKIKEENILQFYEDVGKIKMVVQYQLLEDITTP